MKFGIGNTIIIERPFMSMGRNHIGATGRILEIRSYGSKAPTHYVVKFGCYKIPHIYMIEELESSCRALSELIKQPLMLQSDCVDCQLYEGFGQCYEHGNNLLENCKDYKK